MVLASAAGDLGDRVGRAGVGAGAAGDARRVAEAAVEPGGDVRARSRGRWRSARTCPGPRRRRARSGRTRCRARGGTTRYGWRSSWLGSCVAPGQRGSPTPSCAATAASSVCARRRGSGSSESTSSTTLAAIRRACGSAVSTTMPSRQGVVHAAPDRRALDADQADAAGAERRHAGRRSRASGPSRRPARAASRMVVPGLDLDRDAVDRQTSSLSPSSSGKCASRLRIGAGMPPPCAQRLPTSSVSSSSSSARGRRRRRPRPSRARAAARSGTGSTCRSSRAAPKCEQVPRRARACRCGRRRRRCRRGRPCSPRPRALRSRTACRAATAGQDPAERPADLQRLDRAPVAQAAAELLADARAAASRTAPRTRPGARSARSGRRAWCRARARAERRVGLGAVQRDERDVAERLDVVDDASAAPWKPRSAGNGGRAETVPRRPCERREQRRLLADDVRAGALDDRDVEGEAAAVDVVAESRRPRGLCDRRRRARLASAGTRSARRRSRALGADRVAGERQRPRARGAGLRSIRNLSM